MCHSLAFSSWNPGRYQYPPLHSFKLLALLFSSGKETLPVDLFSHKMWTPMPLIQL